MPFDKPTLLHLTPSLPPLPSFIPHHAAGESLIEEAVQLALAHGWVDPNDHVVVVFRSQQDEVMIKVRNESGGV